MIGLIISLSAYEAFNRANELMNKGNFNVDSVAYYLSVAYDEYSSNVEGILMLKFAEEHQIAGEISTKLVIDYGIRSKLIAFISLNYLFEKRDLKSIYKLEGIDTAFIDKAIKLLKSFNEDIFVDYSFADSLLLPPKGSIATLMILAPQGTVSPAYKFLSKLKLYILKYVCINSEIARCVNYIKNSFILSLDNDTKDELNKLYDYLSANALYMSLTNKYSMDDYMNTLKILFEFLNNMDCEIDTFYMRRYPNFYLLIPEAIYNAKYDSGAYYEVEKYMKTLSILKEKCDGKPQYIYAKAILYAEKDSTWYALKLFDSLKTYMDYLSYTSYLNTLISGGFFKEYYKLCKEGKVSYNCDYISQLVGKEEGCTYYYLKGKYKKALSECSDDDIEKLYSFIMTGQMDSANALLDKHIESIEGKNYIDFWNKGWFYMLKGEIDSGLYYTNLALNLRPANPFLLMNKAHAFLIKGEVDSALHYYKLSRNYNEVMGTYNWKYYYDTFDEDISLMKKLFKLNRGTLRKARKAIGR